MPLLCPRREKTHTKCPFEGKQTPSLTLPPPGVREGGENRNAGAVPLFLPRGGKHKRSPRFRGRGSPVTQLCTGSRPPLTPAGALSPPPGVREGGENRSAGAVPLFPPRGGKHKRNPRFRGRGSPQSRDSSPSPGTNSSRLSGSASYPSNHPGTSPSPRTVAATICLLKTPTCSSAR